MDTPEQLAARRWGHFSLNEIERRRSESVVAVQTIERESFNRWYQEICDRAYWTSGPCCSGCDHWISSEGNSGRCEAAGIVSGADVLRSMGVDFSSYTPPPGLPYTESDFYCGKFSDNFDWSTLDNDYLKRIGAFRNGRLRDKPTRTEEGSE